MLSGARGSPAMYAWKKANYFGMQARDEQKRAERRARKLARQRLTETNNGR